MLENESKLYDTIKVIISSNVFKLLEYRDDINYTHLNTDYNGDDESNKTYVKKNILI